MLTLDRDRRRVAIIFSAAGGMEIEQVAADAPEKIATLWPDPFMGPLPFEIRQMVFDALSLAPQLRDGAAKLATQLVALTQKLYSVTVSLDAMTCEINPLVLTPEGEFVAADGKLEIDESAQYRHAELAEELARDATGDDGKHRATTPTRWRRHVAGSPTCTSMAISG